MKLPNDVVIPIEKLTEYLLARRARNDKSGFLAQADYTTANWRLLESDLCKLVRSSDAESDGFNDFGEFFVVRGELVGPNNSTLKVKTVGFNCPRRTKFDLSRWSPNRNEGS